jgi:hypothetical protein
MTVTVAGALFVTSKVQIVGDNERIDVVGTSGEKAKQKIHRILHVP